MDRYDVIIIGAGPAGIFAALEFSKRKGIKVILLEKGKDISQRECPVSKSKYRCTECSPCHTLCGWGGAGAFSDGKLHLNMTGGFLYRNRHRKGVIQNIINDIDEKYRFFGAPERVFDPPTEKVYDLQKNAGRYNLRLVPSRIRHMGTEICFEVLRGLRKELDGKVKICCSTSVERMLFDGGRAVGVETASGKRIMARYVLVAPGRQGASWLKKETDRIGLKSKSNALDIGLRVEVDHKITTPLTDILYEPKIVYGGKGFKDKVRTFCVCPQGEVVQERSEGVVTVNGHSFFGKKTGNTNFAVLVSVDLDKGLSPLDFGRGIARMVNKGAGGVLVQRLGDLKNGIPSTSEAIDQNSVVPTLKAATAGDIGLFMPYRYLKGILGMLEGLDGLLPGIDGPDTLLYGMEIKFYSNRLPIDENCETQIENLFAAGDGAGLSRGLMQASVSGVLAARGILGKMEKSGANS